MTMASGDTHIRLLLGASVFQLRVAPIPETDFSTAFGLLSARLKELAVPPGDCIASILFVKSSDAAPTEPSAELERIFNESPSPQLKMERWLEVAHPYWTAREQHESVRILRVSVENRRDEFFRISNAVSESVIRSKGVDAPNRDTFLASLVVVEKPSS